MGQGYQAQPEGMAGFAKKLADLQRQIDDLKAAAPIRNAAISGGAGLTLNGGGSVTVDGGDITVLDTNGNQVVKIGHDTAGIRGVAFTSPAGVDMVDFYIEPSTGIPFLRVLDSTGQACLVTNPLSTGVGLGWPWIPFSLAPMVIAQWPYNTTGSFVTVAQCVTNRASQEIFVEARVVCYSGATAGQARLLVNSVQVGSTATVGTGVTDANFGPAAAAGNIGTNQFVELQTRVTAGAGNCAAQAYGGYWLQS
jgi:hypothetical protein